MNLKKNIIQAVLACLSVVLCACGHNTTVPIDLQAHRGGAGLMPENTFSSMKNALDLGVNTLEMDLQISADGHVVLSHDNYLYTMPYDSIAKYEVGLRYTEQWPEKKLLSEHVPLASLLIDYTEKYASENNLPLPNYNIEIKSSADEGEGINWPDYKTFCDTSIPLLLSKNLGKRLIVQTFDVRSLEYIHQNWPEVTLAFLTKKDTDIKEILSRISFLPGWWSPHFSVVTAENVAYCHSLGIKVVPWTVDEQADILAVAGCGVDAIISNYPDRLIELLR